MVHISAAMNMFSLILFSLACASCSRRVQLTSGPERQSSPVQKPQMAEAAELLAELQHSQSETRGGEHSHLNDFARLLVATSSPAAGWQAPLKQSLHGHGHATVSRKLSRVGSSADNGLRRKYESLRPSVKPRTSTIRSQVPMRDDGEEVDWDAEFRKLPALNPVYEQISGIEPAELVAEFAKTAPLEVQHTVKATIASLMGSLPDDVFNSQITTTGRNLASLMFNMQMTGYMFRSAEYRMSLQESLLATSDTTADMDITADDGRPTYEKVALPPVSGTISVKLGQGMETQVDAEAYMSELRSEVENLRMELVAAKEAAKPKGETKLLAYIQKLNPIDQQELTQHVSKEVLEAMSQLVTRILGDLSEEPNTELEVSTGTMRELLISQLVSGYRLREIEIREEMRRRFFDS
mmetsp:Transcript_68709/g.129662  ORF Transcript_68709/g.129662 Transcript_68709/m.129662 type:complete len:410 (+) Transcript_68709:60-1289(+)